MPLCDVFWRLPPNQALQRTGTQPRPGGAPEGEAPAEEGTVEGEYREV
jgi:hypothetical protein